MARSFGADYSPRRFFVKAQVKVEGRTHGYFKENGFIGGVHAVNSLNAVQETAKKILGKKYINEETEDDGFIVNCVYIQEELDVQKGLYLKIDLDHKTQQPVITYSEHGGMLLERIR